MLVYNRPSFAAPICSSFNPTTGSSAICRFALGQSQHAGLESNAFLAATPSPMPAVEATETFPNKALTLERVLQSFGSSAPWASKKSWVWGRRTDSQHRHCCILRLCSSPSSRAVSNARFRPVRCCFEYRTHSEQTTAGRPKWAGDTQYLIHATGFFTRINCKPLTAGRQLLVEQGNGRPERMTRCHPIR
jgi:hypothetical protein